MRYYVVRINTAAHTREYRMCKTISRWTSDRENAYAFATEKVATAVADRERRLLRPSLLRTVTITVEKADPAR